MYKTLIKNRIDGCIVYFGDSFTKFLDMTSLHGKNAHKALKNAWCNEEISMLLYTSKDIEIEHSCENKNRVQTIVTDKIKVQLYISNNRLVIAGTIPDEDIWYIEMILRMSLVPVFYRSLIIDDKSDLNWGASMPMKIFLKKIKKVKQSLVK